MAVETAKDKENAREAKGKAKTGKPMRYSIKNNNRPTDSHILSDNDIIVLKTAKCNLSIAENSDGTIRITTTSQLTLQPQSHLILDIAQAPEQGSKLGPKPEYCNCGCGRKSRDDYHPTIMARVQETGEELQMACGTAEVLKIWTDYRRAVDKGRDWWLCWS